MPELPEVQTVVSDLNKKIVGDIITDFWSDHKKSIKNKFADFVKGTKDRKILEVKRIGKNIFINLSGGKTIHIHLKMTGHLLVKSQPCLPAGRKTKVESEKNYFDDKVNNYVHHIFYLGKNKKMEFSDVRKFAKIVLVDTDKVKELKEIKSLGIDVMSKYFTLKKFQEILEKKSGKKIRDILMEQGILAGIGNIYASEILFEARVYPERNVSSLSKKEIEKIFEATINILKKAIKMRGTSDSDYRDTSGAPGGFQKFLKVYRKTGEKCPSCGTIVKRIRMGQRSAFVCPKCQK